LAIVNTVIAGGWLSVAYYKTRSLWFPTGLHFAWNFVMGAVYGLNISGLDETAKSAVFKVSESGPQWLTGGAYGPEGGAVVTVVFLLGTVWLWRVKWFTPAPESLAGLQPMMGQRNTQNTRIGEALK
jgi:membrane protease YdiL (CAAX protease family)